MWAAMGSAAAVAEREVMAGILEANQAFGTHFRVAANLYAKDDTPPESTYRLLPFKPFLCALYRLQVNSREAAAYFAVMPEPTQMRTL
jgi:hypothetical protein